MTGTPKGICPLTNEPKIMQTTGKDYFIYEPPLAGIKYHLCGTVKLAWEIPDNSFSKNIAENEQIRAKLAFWVYQKNQAGDDHPMINEEVLEQIKAQPYPLIGERTSSYLQWVKKKTYPNLLPHIPTSYDPAGMVATCTIDRANQGELVQGMKKEGYLDCINAPSYGGGNLDSINIRLTLKGLQYCEQLEKS